MRSAALFAFFGFVAAMVRALGEEQPLGETFVSGLRWGFGFGLLGWGIGRVARLIAREVVGTPVSESRAARGDATSATGSGNPEAPASAPGSTTDNRNEEAWVRPDRRHPVGNTPSPDARTVPEHQDETVGGPPAPARSIPTGDAEKAAGEREKAQG